ncbi:LPD25 domain-containing protein [Ruminococcus bicirculans (ex Wegman et al. 2014)]|uniref:LPD25 domain-containing protein n=1 Tax=Ruminococcus bicirculans (ex Wegman et al. 2014) TaxID=1160721 RepID=UPI00242F0002|nr:LPD25 domain-containing protein [Ruminococcus bicirculans (ex Wegman et al. 2014)]MBS6634015.1 DEAD/DEAH box helicase family protein [Ruminococcus bicirculans (ex Wegman et al. 2014)]
MKKTFKSDEEKYELVKLHWFEITEQLRGNKQEYLKYLKYSAGMYKQSYSDAVLVYHQNKNATKIADYKKWKRLGRYVKRGSHGVAVFGENHTCRYLYDVSQTGGKELPEMWTLSGRNTPELIDVLNRRYDIHSESINDCIDFLTAKSIESLPIDESVQNAISEMSLSKKQQETYKESLSSIVRFVVTQRCDLAGQMNMSAETDVDLRAIDMMRNARDMILFSRVVQKAAKSVLSEIEKEVIAIDRKNETLDNAKTAKQESTSDRVNDILKDLIRLKFSQDQILALKQAVVAAAQNGEHNIQHWVSVRYSPDELRHISSLLSDYYAQSVIEQTLDPKGILNDYYTYVTELNGRLKLSDMFSHHEYSDEQKAMLQQGFSEGISITVLNEVDERLTVDEIKTFFEMFHQAVDGQIDPHDVQIYLDKAITEHSKQNVQTVEVQDNSVDTNSVGVVKQYDNDFYINHSEQKSQELSSYQRLHLPEAMNNLDSKEPIRHAAFTDKQLALSVLNDSNDSVSQNDNEVKPSAALSEPTITCEWSESNYFEDGKTYSVAEFDTLMEQADSEMVAGAKAAIEKYGSAKAWYEADADDEFSQFMGYDKVKFTINMPDGQTITERQDAGDGYGGVIDFLKRYSIYSSIIPELETAKAAHMADLVNEVPTPTNETQPEIDKLLGRLKLDCDYYLKTGAEKHLWAETVEKQIAKINELYEKMPENAYFTREQIDDYEKKMLAIKNGEVEKPIPYETPTIANNVLSEEKEATPPVSESTPISVTSDEQISLFETPPASETVTIPDKDVKTEKVENPKKNVKASTYHFDPDNVVVGGAAARCDANIAAIETLLKIESEKRLATPEEQKIMARYSGWGGTAQAFVADNENVSADSWGARQTRLRELLTTDEYSAARSSTLTSFYTPPEVIDSVYLALERFQFEGGNILEPSMGVGNFFAKMPDEMRADSKLYGVELDSISGRIAKQLYPEDNIQIKGFEKTTFKNNSFDVVIGNIPFGDYGIADKAYDKYHFKIHDYFAAKAVDKVKPGGIVAIVTSKFTMDKKNDKARKYLAERCDLLGAVRLPSGTFKDADSVTTDIIFLKKRTTMTSVIPNWVHVSETANGIPCNQYFVDNPDMVLGTMAWDERMRGKYGADSKVTTCYANSDAPLAQQLINAISKIDGVIDTVETELDNGTAEILPADPTVRNFTHTIVDGDLYFRENEIMVKVTETGKSLERMKGLHTLRQATMELINAQADGCTDEQLAELQKKLNSTYDNFRTKFGNITDSANSRCFSNDDDYNTLAALEVVNVENKTVEKAAIFTKRTILPDIPVSKVDTALEALQVSMDRLGKVDILYMSQLTDTTPEKVIADLGDEIFRDPAKVKDNDPYLGYTESSEYLSGNIRDKLRIARDHAEHIDSSYNKNVEALMKVVPKDLEASEISVRIGANWIDVADYNNFFNEYAHANTYYYPVTRTKLGEYKIEGKTSDRSVAATETFGTSRMNSYQIFENLLNQRDILVRDRREEGDKVWYEINTKETQLAKEKARLMKEAFRNWLWEDMGRREKYVAKYNYLFNSIRGREYDGSHQTFPGMNTSITLRKHQSNAIMRAKLGGNTLFAHEVGAGKSFEMVATVMEKKRLGLINKACVVVPKHLTLQMASEWLRLYPNAKLLVAKPEDFTKANRKRFIARCVTGDYDAVIMSFTQFERIPMSDEYKEQFMQKELHDIMSAISETGSRDKSSVKALERQKKNIEERLEKLLSSPKDSSLCFEKLGFDYLVCDEAHNYKNCFVSTKMSNVAGVQTTAAQKSEDMLMKTQYLNNKYGCNNILFATGTPISNSMVEFYVMQRYLRPDLLEKAGLQNFDDWASTFGEVVSQLEIKPAGNGFQMKNRFSKFVNIPELMQMYKEFADIQTADMLKLPVPKLETGKPIVVTSKPDERQKAYMKELATRSETIHSGTVDPRQDNMLKITHEARLLGLDTRCIFKDAQPAPDSKVMKLIDNLEKNYKNTMTEKGVQIVFCDIAINEDETHFSVYKAIKQALMERGIPEKEICFAADAKTDKARDEMFKSLRKGEKRFIIASTSKLGTGANIQDRICAIHHLDIPWKPSDLTQQDGRGIRQGNRFSQVGIYHYLTEETFDAYMMGIITNKAKFINQILTSKSPARVSEDVDEMVLTYSEMQAIASGNPMIKEKIQLDNDVAMLKTLEAEHKKSIYKMQELAEKTLPKQITHYSELLAKSKSDMSKYQEQQALNKEFEMTIGGVRYDKRENAGEQIAVAMAKCTATGEPIELGTYRGFKVTIERNPSANTFFELDTPCIAVLHGELTYSCDVATDNGVGNVRRIENLAGIQINQKLCSLEEQLEKANKDLSEAQQNMLKPFEHGQELAEKTKRLEYVNAQLSGNSQNKNHTPESAIEFRFHNNKYQALIGTNEKSEWCDVVSKGGKLIASSDTKIYNLSEKESDQFRSYVFNGGKTDTSKNNSLLEKLKPKALKL